jgi:hypothetical protein
LEVVRVLMLAYEYFFRRFREHRKQTVQHIHVANLGVKLATARTCAART